MSGTIEASCVREPDPLPGFTATRAKELLAELRRAHEDMADGIAQMEQATATAEPDSSRYPQARWRLSLASRTGRALVEKICKELQPGMTAADAEQLHRLQQEELNGLHASARHVQNWTMTTIAQDWDGYRAASAEIRTAMRTRIEREKAVLYAFLQRAGAWGL
jgi:hypothetical protein